MTVEDRLWKAFPTSEPVASYEIASCILIWESIRGTAEGMEYLQEIRARLASGDELMAMRLADVSPQR